MDNSLRYSALRAAVRSAVRGKTQYEESPALAAEAERAALGAAQAMVDSIFRDEPVFEAGLHVLALRGRAADALMFMSRAALKGLPSALDNITMPEPTEDQLDDVREAWEELRLDQRRAILLFKGGMPVREIGRRMGLPYEGAIQLLSRAYADLRIALYRGGE